MKVCEEAIKLVYGDRHEAYGHALDDFTRTAGMVSALLSHKLNSPLTPEEAALVMICVKLSREVNRPKRDNRVDIAGYAEVLDNIIKERINRDKATTDNGPEGSSIPHGHCSK